MIHAMAEYIWHEGKLWHYAELLKYLGNGTHFAVHHTGQVVQHAEPRQMLWHAAGANQESCGVELLIPGVYTLTELYTKISGDGHDGVYHAAYYRGLLNTMKFLHDDGYVRMPEFGWELHSAQSKGRKRDPGSSFSVDQWTDMLRVEFNGTE